MVVRSSSGRRRGGRVSGRCSGRPTLDRRWRRGLRRSCVAASRLAFAVRAAGIPQGPHRQRSSPAPAPILLAKAGPLDGRRATTHRRRTRQFLVRFSAGEWEPDGSSSVTAISGVRPISAGIDLALALSGGFRRGGRAKDRPPARAPSPPQRRSVAILLAAGVEGAAGRFGRC